MLGYVTSTDRGGADAVLSALAARAQAQGWPVAGVVQVNTDAPRQRRCDMDLAVLGTAQRIRISQRLGEHARGCRLDYDGLEQAVVAVQAQLSGARLLIINKFGKSEAEGRGCRLVIAQAVAAGIPVVVGLKADNCADFMGFAGNFAHALPLDANAILHWAENNAPRG